ncbi:DNA-binding GntR family transcriptional regulator [Arthrobacter sp. GAS37]|uniref:GntR family transcriptional regulator n=1 Tax=Arthrobacter sp. GAS37 TaxID=3156261 RepID=UPI003838FD05
MTIPQLLPLGTRPESLSSLVLEQIKSAIVNKELAPGTKISEASLATQLQVSKTPVREALLRLRHIGLVSPNGSGLQVVQPSRESIREAYELRASLERASARFASTRRTDNEMLLLAEFAEGSLTKTLAGDAQGFREFDAQFHRQVALCSGNDLLNTAIDDALVLTSALRARDVPMTQHDSVSCAKEHVRIAEAIASGRVDIAGEAMEEHVGHVMSMVLAVFDQGESAR